MSQITRSLWQDGTNGVEQKLNNYILQAHLDIPRDLCADESIVTDIVYALGYGETEQMIRMLRAIAKLRYPRG